MSLRKAARQCAPWNVFTGNTCNCSGDCDSQRCPCKKKATDCSSFCHSKKDCKNRKYEVSLTKIPPTSTVVNSSTSCSRSSSKPVLKLPDIVSHNHCLCRTRCNSKKGCLCKRAGLLCLKTCHAGHSCTNVTSSLSTQLTTTDPTTLKDSKDHMQTGWINCSDVLLYTRHKDILSSRSGWLDDLIIDAVQSMLKQQYPQIGGFQPPALSIAFAMTPPQLQFVQVINIKRNHWVTLSTVGCQQSIIKICDSMGGRLPKSSPSS